MKNRWIQLKLRRGKEGSARPSNKEGVKLERDDSGACRASYRIGSSRTVSGTANANATGAELIKPNSSRNSSDQSVCSNSTLESGSWFRTSPPIFQVHEFSIDDIFTVTR